MTFDAWTGWAVYAAGHGLGLFAAVHALLHKKRNPSGALVWVVFCAAVPFLGAGLYATIGYDRVSKRRRRRIRAAHREFFAEERRRRTASGADPAIDACPLPTMRRLSDAPARGGNAADALVGGVEGYARMLDAVEHAQRHVYLQTYIFDGDATGRRFVEALAERAKNGVRVRVLYDAVGTSSRGAALLREGLHGVGEARVASFLPFHPLKRRFQVNLRNHRKILAVDDGRAFIGSLNVSDRHLRDDEQGSRDFVVDVRGPAADDLAAVFASDWRFATGERLPPGGGTASGTGEDVLQIFESGPDHVDAGVQRAIVAALYAARSDVLAITPYFVPPPELLTALQTAAARGVRVRLLIPGRSNHRLIHYATRSFLPPLLEEGVRAAERKGALLHMKVLVVDDEIAVFGSSNLDYRSFFLNFEADAVVYGGALQRRLREIAETEWRASEPLSEERFSKLPVWERLAIRAAALCAPVL